MSHNPNKAKTETSIFCLWHLSCVN